MNNRKTFVSLFSFFVISLVITKVHAQSWTTLNVGAVSEVPYLSFPTNDTGYVSLANGQMRKTVDGALNWTSCNINTSVAVDLEFISGTYGFVVDGSTIRKTSDGGQTWTNAISNSFVAFYDICFANNSVGYASGTSQAIDTLYIYKTIDGGSTWSLLPAVTGPFNPFYPYMYFTTPLIGFVMAESYILRTTDGGLTWNSEYTVPNSDAVYSMWSPDGVNIFGGCWTSAFVSSIDGGDNWTSGTNTAWPGYGIYFTTATHGYVCGGNGLSTGVIEETNNGGTTWTPVHTGNSFYCMEFPSLTTGYVGGTNGVIVKYSEATSVQETSGPIISCYPNPASDWITIENVQVGSVVSMHNALAEMVFTQAAMSDRIQIDVRDLAAGIYFVNVSGDLIETRRIVVVR
jgi:photosystem II stability/assembly factor-like uncharacterized protein